MRIDRLAPSMCKTLDNEFAIVTAGKTRTVERFNFSANKWEAMPDLHYLRRNHSSCTMKDSVYVFYGMTGEFRTGLGYIYEMSNSIENLKFGRERWQHFDIVP